MKRGIILFILIVLQLSCSSAAEKKLRIVSLAPNITESLFAIGVGEKEIVGITDYCNYPKEAAGIRKVGSLMSVNIETIVSMDPDYVFSSGSEFSPSNVRIKNAGLRLIVLNAESVGEAMSNILRLGKILGKDAEAKEAVRRMKNRLAKVKNSADRIKTRKKVYVEIWDDPITSAGDGSLVNEVVTMAGGINIAGRIGMLYPALSPEFVINSNPDFMLIGYMSRNQEHTKSIITKRLGWQDINAVKSKNIICDINPDIFLRPGPRIVEGIEIIYKKLYPLSQLATADSAQEIH